MPLYEYISESPDDPDSSCSVCRKGFELHRPIDRHALEACPLCRNGVKKRISRVNTPKITKPFSTTDAKKAGFTVLEKRDTGVYEKM
jgi:predicted nucleic acid-binding Zn ribbon protein